MSNPRRLLWLASAIVAAITAQPLRAQDAGDSRTARVGDVDMRYRVLGAGEPLLLLHGFGSCAAAWEPHVAELSARYRLVIPDLRGHGGTTNPARTFTHRQSAADVIALLDALRLPRVRAMGISTGGMTLLHLATRAPERLEAMVLIGATTYFPEEARRILREVSAENLPPDVRGEYDRCATRGDAQVRELLTQFAGFAHSYDDMNFTPPLLSTIRVPTLIVHGDRDVFFPVDIPVQMYRSMPDARLWIVPGGDHVPIYGPRAAHFRREALDFLARPTRPARR